jgi:sugar diacid utilization regulator
MIYLTSTIRDSTNNRPKRLLSTNCVSVQSNEAPVVQSTNEEGYYHEITDDEQAVYDEINMDYQQARDVQAVAADHSVVSQQYQYEELNLQPTIVNKDRHSK